MRAAQKEIVLQPLAVVEVCSPCIQSDYDIMLWYADVAKLAAVHAWMCTFKQSQLHTHSSIVCVNLYTGSRHDAAGQATLQDHTLQAFEYDSA